MFANQYDHQIIRRYTIAFGNLFNDIVIQRKSETTGNKIQTINVPLKYASKESFFERTRHAATFRNRAITLPAMGFVIVDYQYDGARKLQSTQRQKTFTVGNDTAKTTFVPVPYNISFQLNVFVRNTEDGTQILEQILPYFRPEFTPTVAVLPELDISFDAPVQLQGVGVEDVYEGDMVTRQALVYTLDFIMYAHLYGPIENKGVITRSYVNQIEGIPGDPNAIRPPQTVGQIIVTANGVTIQTGDFGFSNETSGAGADPILDFLGLGNIRLYDADQTNYVELKGAPNIPANYNFIFPADAGEAGQLLSTDGSGTLSWVAAEAANTAYYEFLTNANFRIGNTGTYMTEIVNNLSGSVTNTQLATAESIKTYVDSQFSSVAITGGTITGVILSNLDEPLSVEDGGTGLTSLTENGVLYGLTSNNITFATGSGIGEVLQLAANSTPFFSNTIDGGTF